MDRSECESHALPSEPAPTVERQLSLVSDELQDVVAWLRQQDAEFGVVFARLKVLTEQVGMLHAMASRLEAELDRENRGPSPS